MCSQKRLKAELDAYFELNKPRYPNHGVRSQRRTATSWSDGEDKVKYSGLHEVHGRAQFEMLFALVYDVALKGVGAIAGEIALCIMHCVAPVCGCYIEHWDVRYSEWDVFNSITPMEPTAEGMVSEMGLRRLRGDSRFGLSLGRASVSMTHEHVVSESESDEEGSEGGIWRPIDGHYVGVLSERDLRQRRCFRPDVVYSLGWARTAMPRASDGHAVKRECTCGDCEF